ncbi:MAG: hypothetical protein PF503_09540 [Desulfobacula sp.]|nr:hypothetical protein [Desulfobacula sp.]
MPRVNTGMWYQTLLLLNKYMGIRLGYVFLIWLLFLSSGFAATYEFGDGRQYSYFREFNWDSLKPGDIVNIYKKSRPYREKLVLNSSGTRKNPIRIQGVPDKNGNLPVIDGSGAVHFQKLCMESHYSRGLIIIGDCKPADFIIIKNLELKNANNKSFYRLNNLNLSYTKNAAGIFLWKGKYLLIKNCIIHSCGMGVLTNTYPNTDHFYLGYSRIYNNGDFTRKGWGHNVYIQARKTLIEFNRFGELFSDGNNIKDRSNVTVIRYNWIAGGMSRQIDLVENFKYGDQDAFVYGNFITHGKNIKNPKMILFGGDLLDKDQKQLGSRSGKLYFFNNTMISKVTTDEGFLYINRSDCKASLQNNVMLGRKKIWSGNGQVTGSNNLFSSGTETQGFLNSFQGGVEQLSGKDNSPYQPGKDSLLVNAGDGKLPAKVRFVPSPFPRAVPRSSDGAIDIGAFEYSKK